MSGRLPELEVAHEFLHGHGVQKHEVGFSKLQALVLRHGRLPVLLPARVGKCVEQVAVKWRQECEHWRASPSWAPQWTALCWTRGAIRALKVNFTHYSLFLKINEVDKLLNSAKLGPSFLMEILNYPHVHPKSPETSPGPVTPRSSRVRFPGVSLLSSFAEPSTNSTGAASPRPLLLLLLQVPAPRRGVGQSPAPCIPLTTTAPAFLMHT